MSRPQLLLHLLLLVLSLCRTVNHRCRLRFLLPCLLLQPNPRQKHISSTFNYSLPFQQHFRRYNLRYKSGYKSIIHVSCNKPLSGYKFWQRSCPNIYTVMDLYHQTCNGLRAYSQTYNQAYILVGVANMESMIIHLKMVITIVSNKVCKCVFELEPLLAGHPFAQPSLMIVHVFS